MSSRSRVSASCVTRRLDATCCANFICKLWQKRDLYANLASLFGASLRLRLWFLALLYFNDLRQSANIWGMRRCPHAKCLLSYLAKKCEILTQRQSNFSLHFAPICGSDWGSDPKLGIGNRELGSTPFTATRPLMIFEYITLGLILTHSHSAWLLLFCILHLAGCQVVSDI